MASEKVKAIVSQRHFESVGVEEKNKKSGPSFQSISSEALCEWIIS